MSDADLSSNSSQTPDSSPLRRRVDQKFKNMQSSTQLPDVETLDHKSCPLCKKSFTMFRAKHRCAKCMTKVCDYCSKNRFHISGSKKKRGSRLCDLCAKDYMIEFNDIPQNKSFLSSSKVFNNLHKQKNNVDLCLDDTSPSSLLHGRHYTLGVVLCFVVFVRVMFDVSEESWCSFTIPLYLVVFIRNLVNIRIYSMVLLVTVLGDEYFRIFYTKKSKYKVPNTSLAKPNANEIKDDEEDISVDTGDNPKEQFTLDTLSSALSSCTIYEEIRVIPFIRCCREIGKFVGSLGRSTSFASSTVENYIRTLEEKYAVNQPNIATTSGVCDEKYGHTIAQLIEYEVLHDVAHSGGKKNPSMSRCILRLLWFVEFVLAWIRYCYLESEEDDSSGNAIKAYEETLGKHHQWIIRKGAIAVLGSAPSRSSVLESLIAGLGNSESNLKDVIKELEISKRKLELIVKRVYQPLEKNDLLNIK